MPKIDHRTYTIIQEFTNQFQSNPTHVSIGPGRVNLIGEHTDYNDGFVLPVALDRDVRLVLRPRDDRLVRLYALEFDSWSEFHLDELQRSDETLWVNYVMGVAWALQERGIHLNGLDGVISGNVPRGSGLSSSAALEISCAKGFLAASNQSAALSGRDIALAAQQAENDFVGVNCGIMDQFVSALGAEGHALLIDCRSLEYRLVPFPEEAALVIGNTKASRSLASSAYNERRKECETGVAILRQVLPSVKALRDVSSEQLKAAKDLLPPVVYRRCWHVITENERVMATVNALAEGDLGTVGNLMNASHDSLRDDYEVSSPALDAMVEAMRSVDGCFGARLTGAGFGGCAVALVARGREEAVSDAIYDHYARAMNIWPEVYISRPSSGARVIELQ
jgi:galactokinase